MAYVRSQTFDDQSNVVDSSFRPRAYPASKARQLRGAGPAPVPVASLKRPLIIRAANLSFDSSNASDLQDQSKLMLVHPRAIVATPTRVYPQGPPDHPAHPTVSVPRILTDLPGGRAIQPPGRAIAAGAIQGQHPLKLTRKPKQGMRGLGQNEPPPGFDAAGNYIGPVVAPSTPPFASIPPLSAAPVIGAEALGPLPPADLFATTVVGAAQQARGGVLSAFQPAFGSGVAVPKFAGGAPLPTTPSGGRTGVPVLTAGVPSGFLSQQSIPGIPNSYLLGFMALVAVVFSAKKKR